MFELSGSGLVGSPVAAPPPFAHPKQWLLERYQEKVTQQHFVQSGRQEGTGTSVAWVAPSSAKSLGQAAVWETANSQSVQAQTACSLHCKHVRKDALDNIPLISS